MRGSEKNAVAKSNKSVWVTGTRSAVNILNHHCPIGCTVALPQFGSVGSVVGLEIDGGANGCEVGGITAVTSVVDVLDHHRAIGCSIALPQFVSVGSVVCLEIEGVTNRCEGGRESLLAHFRC